MPDATGVGAAAQAGGSILEFIGTLIKGSAPTYAPVDLSSAAGQSIAYNENVLPKAKALAGDVNVFNEEQVLKALRTAIPDYDKMMAQSESIINAEETGQFAPGEKRALEDLGASLGIKSGTVGSTFSDMTTLGLGFDALERRYNEGVNSSARWLQLANQMTRAPLMDLTSMFVSPMQAAEFVAKQHELQFESQLGKWMQPNAFQAAGQTLAGVGGTYAASEGFGLQSGGGNEDYTDHDLSGNYGPSSPPVDLNEAAAIGLE